MVYGELLLAQNMDRALFVSNPVVTGLDQRMFGWSAAAWQEITRWGIAGIRIDVYDPNSDLFDQRAGRLHPDDQRITTFTWLAGLRLEDRARLLLQHEIIRDRLGRDQAGVPTDLANNAWTLRLQVQL
jgi:hypothetical protein